MFPPPTVEKSLEPVDLMALVPDPPVTSPQSPWDKTIRRVAFAGAMAGICLGVFVNVGVFAHATPVDQAQSQARTAQAPASVLTDIPAPPQLIEVDEVVIISKAPPLVPSRPKMFTNPPPQGFKCHVEILAGGRGVRVCRPDSIAASPIPVRSTNDLR